MRVVALISGGKDSCFNLMQCVAAGHEIVALANLHPQHQDELDSYMYQTVGHQGIILYAEALGLPLYRELTHGIAHQNEKWYKPTEGDEVEDLYNLLVKIKDDLDFEGVSSGAVLSDYQRLRVENVCSRLGLTSLAYLWRRNQEELLQEMIDSKIDAVVIKVAALGLDPSKHLGLTLSELQPHLIKMNEKYGLNVCGEGGEYETFTRDCPFFSKRIVIHEFDTVIHSDDAIAPVGYLNFKKLSLADKPENCNHNSFAHTCSIKGPLEYVSDLELPDELLVSDTDGDNVNDLQDDPSLEPDTGNERADIVIFQEVHHTTCINSAGWCWISSIIGYGFDDCEALSMALQKLLDTLTANGYAITDLVAVTLYVNDLTQFASLNATYTRVVDPMNAPIRVCVETSLPTGSPILMNAVAYKLTDTASGERRTMHVQSISHWAPANIGPYSQSVKVGDIIYVAGQIALVPGSMQMVDGGIAQECKLALRHVSRIINAMDQKTLLRDVVQVICYVTNEKYIRAARKEWEKRSNNAISDYIVVPSLPRNAKIEWQVWAHRGNARFQYEETGCRIDKRHKAFLRRRFNYENTVSAVVCNLTRDNGASVEGDIAIATDNIDMLEQFHVEETIKYTLAKLMCGDPEPIDQSCSLKIFYPTNQQVIIRYAYDILEELKNNLCIAYTFIPVVRLHNANTILSLTALRHI